LPPALLPEHEPHLARRPKPFGGVRPERRARLIELEGTEAVPPEEAVVARHLPPIAALVHPEIPFTRPSQDGHRKTHGGDAFKPLLRKTHRLPVYLANTLQSDEKARTCGVSMPHRRRFSWRGVGERLTMRVLVTGVSGYVGAALVPRLQAAGHEVRGFARSPERVAAAGVVLDDVVIGDAVNGAGLGQALDGVDAAYYLIHSMEGQANSGFPEHERRAAERFATAARAAGVRRIV
jgi:putative NAD(P)-binding protein